MYLSSSLFLIFPFLFPSSLPQPSFSPSFGAAAKGKEEEKWTKKVGDEGEEGGFIKTDKTDSLFLPDKKQKNASPPFPLSQERDFCIPVRSGIWESVGCVCFSLSLSLIPFIFLFHFSHPFSPPRCCTKKFFEGVLLQRKALPSPTEK